METINVIITICCVIVVYVFFRMKKIYRRRKIIYETFGVKLEDLENNSPEFGFISLYNFLSKRNKNLLGIEGNALIVIRTIKEFFLKEDVEVYNKYNLNIYVYYEIMLFLCVISKHHMNMLYNRNEVELHHVMCIDNLFEIIKVSFSSMLGEEYTQTVYNERLLEYSGKRLLDPIDDIRYLTGLRNHFQNVLLRNIVKTGSKHYGRNSSELSVEGHVELIGSILLFEASHQSSFLNSMRVVASIMSS